MYGEIGMMSDKFVDVPLTVSSFGIGNVVGGIGRGDEEEWEDADVDAEEMRSTAARPWKEELE